jgi:transposase
MTKKIRTYSAEFKAEAVKKIADSNGNISATAKQLGIAMKTLSNWHNEANQGKLLGTEQYDPELMAAIQKIKQLKRQLKVAEEEREILKKATAYFAKHSESGTPL